MRHPPFTQYLPFKFIVYFLYILCYVSLIYICQIHSILLYGKLFICAPYLIILLITYNFCYKYVGNLFVLDGKIEHILVKFRFSEYILLLLRGIQIMANYAEEGLTVTDKN